MIQCIKLSNSDGGHCDDDALLGAFQGAMSLDWAYQPNPQLPEENIFTGNLPFADEPAGSSINEDAGLLRVSEDKEAIPPSGISQANTPVALPQSVFLDMCE